MNHEILGFITNIRGSQLFIIIFVVLILFGTKRLPDIARGIGKAIKEFRSSASDVEREIRASVNTTEVAKREEPVKTTSTEAQNEPSIKS